MELRGKPVADSILSEVSERLTSLGAVGWRATLASITIGEGAASDLYLRNQQRTAERVGINFLDKRFPGDIGEAELLASIGQLNADPRVTGIIMQRPTPAHLPVRTVQRRIHPLKDVEGMHPASIGNIVYNDLELGPCTAMASVRLLHETGLQLPGLEVTVIGHSEIVGKPIAFMLMAEGATVTVCHHRTRNLNVHARRADAVFVAVGKPGLVTGKMLKPGAALIDIGINQVEGADGRQHTVGDADFASCAEVAEWITPVPGGVGPVTVAMLMRNTLTALQRQKRTYERFMEIGERPAAPA